MGNLSAFFLFLISLPALADVPGVREPQTRQEAQDLMDEAARDFATSRNLHAALFSDAQRLAQLSQQAAKAASEGAAALARLVQSGAAPEQLLAAAKQLQDTQAAYNQQYGQLQTNMVSENRSYNTVSNAMKAKHEAVKSGLGNNLCN